MKNAEKFIRELIASKHYGRKINLELWKDELRRPLHVAALYSCYGYLSTLIIEVQGSPPRGLMIVRFGSYSKEPIHLFLEDSNFRLRRINLQEMRIAGERGWRKYEEIAGAIAAFISERKIPYFKEGENESETLP